MQSPEVFYKKAVLKNFAMFTKKTPLLESLFNKVAVLRPKALQFIKKRLQQRHFLVNIAKFLRTPILKNISKQLLLWLDKKSMRKRYRNEEFFVSVFYRLDRDIFRIKPNI